MENYIVYKSLNEAFSTPEKVFALELRQSGMNGYKDITDEILKFENLEILILHFLEIKQLPECIGKFKNLKHLAIRGFKEFFELPESYYHLENLEIFDISFSEKIKVDLVKLSKLHKLKTINFQSNSYIEDLPDDWNNFKNLEKINLHFTKVKAFPKDFFKKLSNLKVLEISYTKISELPEELFAHNPLEKLIFERNDLKELPNSIWKCTTLKELELYSHQLTALSADIKQLTNLELLGLGGSCRRLVSFPDEIGYLINLKKLDIREAGFEKLPKTIGQLQNLETLSITSSNLSEFPDELTHIKSLKKLECSSSKLTKLPENIGFLINLESIDIGSTLVEQLPDSFCNLVNLDSITAGYGKLKKIPENFGKLKKLRCAFLSKNKLETIPDSIGELENIEYLDLNDNHLKTIPDSIFNLPKLSEINLSGMEFDKELVEKLKKFHGSKGYKPRVILPKVKKEKKAKKIQANVEIDPKILKEFERLNIQVVEQKKPYKLEKDGETYEVPASMHTIFESILQSKKKFYYDKYADSCPSMIMEPISPYNYPEDHQAVQGEPFFTLFWDMHYSMYMLKADDENPSNPDYYFLDHDDYETDELEPYGKVSELLSEFYTRELANELIKDPDYEADVEEIALYIWTKDSDHEELQRIDVHDSGVQSLKGLENYMNLKRLNLGNNSISDISALSPLSKLEELQLHNNKIKDISALADKKFLETLNLQNNQIEDISALKSCTDIQTLYLDDNQIEDISVLESLQRLRCLSLSKNLINDYSVLAKLPKLENIFCRGMKKTEISKIKKIVGTKVNVS